MAAKRPGWEDGSRRAYNEAPSPRRRRGPPFYATPRASTIPHMDAPPQHVVTTRMHETGWKRLRPGLVGRSIQDAGCGLRRMHLLGSRVNKEFLVCVLAALRDCIGAYP